MVPEDDGFIKEAIKSSVLHKLNFSGFYDMWLLYGQDMNTQFELEVSHAECWHSVVKMRVTNGNPAVSELRFRSSWATELPKPQDK